MGPFAMKTKNVIDKRKCQAHICGKIDYVYVCETCRQNNSRRLTAWPESLILLKAIDPVFMSYYKDKEEEVSFRIVICNCTSEKS